VGVRLGVVAVAVVLAVAGCSGGDAPSSALPSGSAPPQSSSPPSNPPSTAATTPPPSAPTLPATATQDTPTGAQSFARYYIEVLDYAYRAGDTQLLRQLAHCPGCDAVADGIDKFISAGGRYEGGQLSVVSAETVRYAAGQAGLVSMVYSRSERELVSPDGKRDKVNRAPALKVLITERRKASGWLITNIQTVR
jgi:Family of unknown function (DUF6318)